MNTKLENRISMYYKVIEFFSNHLTTLDPRSPALNTNVGTFSTQVGELDTLIQTADENTSGYATQKQNNRSAMQELALTISGALYAYGKINNDEPLAAKAYATKSGLNGKRDTDVLYTCERLQQLANDNAANIADMGIDATKLTAFDTAVAAFKDTIQDPADRRSEGKAAFQEAERKVDEIDDTLAITDALMLALSADFSQLYDQYRADRLIDDNASGVSSPDVIELIAAGTTETLFEVPYLASRSFKLKNTSQQEVLWALSSDGSTPVSEWQRLAANTSSTLQSSTLGNSGDLLIVNNPGGTDVTVELTVIE